MPCGIDHEGYFNWVDHYSSSGDSYCDHYCIDEKWEYCYCGDYECEEECGEDENNCPSDCQGLPQGCEDSDVSNTYPDVKDIYLAGNVIYNSMTYPDVCTGEDGIRE